MRSEPGWEAYPAVIVWPGIVGIRPAFRAIGKRVAGSG
jgi:dienelactone hydrolase